MGNGLMAYDPEEVLRDILAASKGSDSDVTGILEVEKEDGLSPYEQFRRLRGIQWPAPSAEIARRGGTPRRYLGQEAWTGKPYGAFCHSDGKARFKLCEQDYSRIRKICGQLMTYGYRSQPGEGPFIIDELAAAKEEGRQNLLETARDNALPPELPDLEVYQDMSKNLDDHKAADKHPFWLSTGIVYEHFHTAKTIRGETTIELVPEQYVETNKEDAERFGLCDGDRVRLVTRRGSYEARVSIGLGSTIKPARNEVPPGLLFSPYNLSVADSAEPTKNKWLVNAVTHRAFDPVSGQADFKKLAARIERISS